MSSSFNLQNAISWCAPYMNFQPLMIGGPEPALTNANLVLQTILGPPFCWRWNRAETTFVCTLVDQDYVKALPDFGFIEKVWLKSADGNVIKEMQVKNSQAGTKEVGRPEFVSAQSDDGAGNITFRLNVLAAEAFTVTVLYQKKATLMTSLASTWAPIPDECSYIFNWGFLAISAMLIDDVRFPIFSNKFTSHLLGAQDGLDEMQRNIFLGNWLEITKQVQRASNQSAQGTTARQQ